MELLRCENISKTYGSGDTTVRALDHVSFSVEKGEFVSIIGPSGSGKSTLLHMLGGLDRPTSGKVFIDGKDIFSMKDEELTIFRRRKVGFVFQAFNLVSTLNVYENIVSCIPALHNYAFAGSGVTPNAVYNCSCFFRTSPTISALPGAS